MLAVSFIENGDNTMVSATAQTTVIRANKKRSQGRKRKNQLANAGSTRSQKELFGSEEPAEAGSKKTKKSK
jgi:hypothetical protein